MEYNLKLFSDFYSILFTSDEIFYNYPNENIILKSIKLMSYLV